MDRMSVGTCVKCQAHSKVDVIKRLCKVCLTQSHRIPCKRKRYESEVSAKSGISVFSSETQITEIQDDDLECDGPHSDNESDGERSETGAKSIEFDLHSVGSLSSLRYAITPDKTVPRKSNMPEQTHRRKMSVHNSQSSLSTDTQTPFALQNRQFVFAQNSRRRQPRIGKNYSESDSGGFNPRPYYNRRYSADDENLIEVCPQNESVVLLNEDLDNKPKIYLARPVIAVKSDPNLHSLRRDVPNVYDSVTDDDSGYVKTQFVPRANEQNAQQGRLKADKAAEAGLCMCDNGKCTLTNKKVLCLVVVIAVIAWVPVAVLSTLLLTSMHVDDGSTSEDKPTLSSAQKTAIEEYIQQEVTNRVHGLVASNSAPLRLEGVGLKEETVHGLGGRRFTNYRFQWTVAQYFIQNPISLMTDKSVVLVNVTGYYSIYCRIHYVGNQHTRQPVSVEHSLYKVNSARYDLKLDTVSQHCMFLNDSRTEHTSTMQTLVFLEAGAKIYVGLKNVEYLDKKNYSKHVMGIFLLPHIS